MYWDVLEPMTRNTFKNRIHSSGRASGDGHNGLSAFYRGMPQITETMSKLDQVGTEASPGLGAP